MKLSLYDLVIFAKSLTRFLHRTTVIVTGSGALMLAISSSFAMLGFVLTFMRVLAGKTTVLESTRAEKW